MTHSAERTQAGGRVRALGPTLHPDPAEAGQPHSFIRICASSISSGKGDLPNVPRHCLVSRGGSPAQVKMSSEHKMHLALRDLVQ